MSYYQNQTCPSGIYSRSDPKRCLKTRIVECIDNKCKVKEVGYDNKTEFYMYDNRSIFQKIKENPLFKISFFILKIFNIPIILVTEIIDLTRNRRF